jgi:hypothetical protein
VGRVAAAPAHADLQLIGGGHHRAAAHHRRAGREGRGDMQAQRDIHIRPLEDAVLDHRPRAAQALLSRLKHQLDRAGERIAMAG